MKTVRSIANDTVYPFNEENGQILSLFDEIIAQIFERVDFTDFGSCLALNKRWGRLKERFVERHIDKLFQTVRMFSPGDWNTHFGDDFIDPKEIKEAKSTFPLNINRISCPIHKHEKLIDNFVIFYIPKNLTINVYGELLKKKFKYKDGYHLIWNRIIEEFGDIQLPRYGWKAMSREIIPNSKGKPFHYRTKMVKDLNKNEVEVYRIPRVLEAIVCVSTNFFKEDKKLYDCKYINCNEMIDDHQVAMKYHENGDLVITGFDLSFHSFIGAVVSAAYKR